MATGNDRRQDTRDNLSGVDAGSFAISRGQKAVSGIRNVSAPTPTVDRLFESVGNWGNKKFAEAATAKYEKSMLEGKMAYQQGQDMKALQESGVDEWALEGYRLMDAKSTAATVLQAQLTEINTAGGDALSPDEYRAQWTDRVNQSTEGKDPQTQRMIREMAAEHIPELAAQHTASHLVWKEDQNYRALSKSVQTMGKDEASRKDLIAFATGQSGSNGLTPDRREAAVVDGVRNALAQGDSASYDALEEAGVFESYSADSMNKIRAARVTYENVERQKWNEDLYKKQQDIIKNVEINGDPFDAVNQMIKLYDEYDLTLGREEAINILNVSGSVRETKRAEQGLNLDTMRMYGDYKGMAKAVRGAQQFAESGNNPNAVSPKGATGLMQVMPSTADGDPNLGFPSIHTFAQGMGITGTKDDLLRNPAVNGPYGELYMEKLLARYNGDMKYALAAYNWGYGRVDKWKREGGQMSALPEETRLYVEKITKNLGAPVNAESEHAIATARYEASREAFAADQHMLFQARVAEMTEQLRTTGNVEDFMVQWADASTTYNQARNMANANQQVAVLNESIQYARAQDAKAQAEFETESGKVFKAEAEESIRQTKAKVDEANKRGASFDEIVSIVDEGRAGIGKLAEKYGAVVPPSAIVSQIQDFGRQSEEIAATATKIAADRAAIVMTSGRGNMDPSLHDQAWKDFQNNRLKGVVEKGIGELAAKGLSQEEIAQQAPALRNAAVNDFIATEGVIPKDQARAMASILGGNWLTPDGKLDGQTLSVLEDFRAIYSKNPEAARAMVQNDDAIYQKAKHVMDLGAVWGPDGLAVAANIVAKAPPMTEWSDEQKAQMQADLDKDLKSELNDVFNVNMLDIGKSMSFSELSNSTVTRRSMFDGNGGLGPNPFFWWDENLNPDSVIVNTITDVARRNAVALAKNVPGITAKEARKQGLQSTLDRGAVVGNSFVSPPSDQASIKHQMFGTEQVKNPFAVDQAIRQYLTNPEVIAMLGLPQLSKMRGTDLVSMLSSGLPSMGDGPDTSVAPYSMYQTRGQYFVHVELPTGWGRLDIPVDLAAVGDLYLRNQRKK